MTDKLSERMRNTKGVPSARAARIIDWADEVAQLEQQVEHCGRFKLFLEIVGGIDADFAWSETAPAQQEEA